MVTNTHTSQSDCGHQPTLVALLSHIPSDHVGTKGEPYAQEGCPWVFRPNVKHRSTVIFSVSCRIQLGTCDGNTRAYETNERSVLGDVMRILLHPRKLTTTALKPKPPSDFGVTAGAKIALTYDSWEPRICVSRETPTICNHSQTSRKSMCYDDDRSVIWDISIARRCKIQTSDRNLDKVAWVVGWTRQHTMCHRQPFAGVSFECVSGLVENLARYPTDLRYATLSTLVKSPTTQYAV